MRPPRLSALAFALIVAVGVGLGACHRAAPDSPEYQQAFELYTKLYASKLDDAYGDSRMQQVLALLGKVDPASSRAEEAKELKAKVEQGLAALKKRQDTVAEDQKAAEKPAEWVGSPTSPPPAAPAAAPAAVTGPSLGMSRADFLAKFGNCFDLKGLYRQGDKQGEAYLVKETCAKQFPGFDKSLVILLDDQVSRLLPLNDATTLGPDAGPKEEPAPPPPAEPPPPTAPLLPGMPRPDAPPAPPPESP